MSLLTVYANCVGCFVACLARQANLIALFHIWEFRITVACAGFKRLNNSTRSRFVTASTHRYCKMSGGNRKGVHKCARKRGCVVAYGGTRATAPSPKQLKCHLAFGLDQPISSTEVTLNTLAHR
jgi:hypothetical protein